VKNGSNPEDYSAFKVWENEATLSFSDSKTN
jgi:hypothetical protein